MREVTGVRKGSEEKREKGPSDEKVRKAPHTPPAPPKTVYTILQKYRGSSRNM